jgi:hypothetical protein
VATITLWISQLEELHKLNHQLSFNWNSNDVQMYFLEYIPNVSTDQSELYLDELYVPHFWLGEDKTIGLYHNEYISYIKHNLTIKLQM